MPFLTNSPKVLSPSGEKENPAIKFNNSAITTTDNDSTSSPVTPRKTRSPFPTTTNSTATTTPHPELEQPNQPKSKSKKSKRSRRERLGTNDSDAALRAEFHDSEDEQEAINRRKSRAFPKGKLKRFERKDSMIDYDQGEIGAMEANARLGGLERRLGRIEELLQQVVSVANGDPDPDPDARVRFDPHEHAGPAAQLHGGRGRADTLAIEEAARIDSDAETEEALRNDMAMSKL